MALFTPTNQKRLTNVSVVRLRKGGNRYELACYPNKVCAWRERLETNLDEVLQIQCVFSNVSKGQFANKKDMYQTFRTENETQIIKMILEQGELQLTEKERTVQQQNVFRDVAKIVSDRCVNPETNRAYTVTMIEKMMKDCHISLKANKSAKQHALEVIRQLRAVDGFKIAPAMMEVVISVDKDYIDGVKNKLLELSTDVIRQGFSDTGHYDMAIVIEPENYGTIEGYLHQEIKGKYCIEIVGNAKHGASRRTINKVPLDPPEEPVGHSKKPLVKPVEEEVKEEVSEVHSDAKETEVLPSEKTQTKSGKRQRRQKRKGKKSKDDWPEDDDVL